MEAFRWDKRFFETTRGRVLLHLRRSPHTVSELAELLELTDNAVRGHLAALERDGVVEQSGVRRGLGKPAYVYRPTAAAERAFGRAASVVLSAVLDVLGERFAATDLEVLLAEAGRRAAVGAGVQGCTLRERLEETLGVLAGLGGMAEVVEGNDGRTLICAFGCPLAAVVETHPEACEVAAALVSELLRVPVIERCERGERPRCVFEVEGACAESVVERSPS